MDLKHFLLVSLVLSLRRYVKGQDCGYPGSPAHGDIEPSKESYNVGETVSYFCHGRSVLMGAKQRQCQRDGTWSNEVPVCGTALHPLGSSVASQYETNHRPELAVDGKKNTCTQINPRIARWWRVSLETIHLVQAVAITMPDKSGEHKFTLYVVTRNASKTGYSKCASFQGIFASQTLLLSCAEGKGLKGHIVHIEDNRNQEQPFYLCEVEVYVKKDMYECGKPETKPLSFVVERTPEMVKYGCSNRFVLDGPEERHCLPTGRWSGEAPRCRDSSCRSPPSIPRGTVDMFHAQDNGLSVGSYVFYTCHPGYMLLGNSTRMCKENGKWSGEPPSCHPVSCKLPKIDDEDVTYKLLNDTTEYNSIARVYCKSNDKIWATIKCSVKGIWTETVLNCTNPVFGTAVMQSGDKPELYFTEGILVALVFAGVVIAIIAISLIIWQRKDPTPMMEIDPSELKEDASSTPKPTNHQAPDLEISLTTSAIKAEEEVKSEEEATARPNYPWSAYIRPKNAKVRSLPLPPSRKSSAAGSKENIYEEIALWARRAASVGGTLEDNKIPPQLGGTNTSRSMNPELLALYAKVDFDKKRKSRQMKEQSVVDVTEEGPPVTSDDSQPFPLRELPPIPTEELSSSDEELSDELSVRNSTSPEVQQQNSSQETGEIRERKSSPETENVILRKRTPETMNSIVRNNSPVKECSEEESSSSA